MAASGLIPAHDATPFIPSMASCDQVFGSLHRAIPHRSVARKAPTVLVRTAFSSRESRGLTPTMTSCAACTARSASWPRRYQSES